MHPMVLLPDLFYNEDNCLVFPLLFYSLKQNIHESHRVLCSFNETEIFLLHFSFYSFAHLLKCDLFNLCDRRNYKLEARNVTQVQDTEVGSQHSRPLVSCYNHHIRCGLIQQ